MLGRFDDSEREAEMALAMNRTDVMAMNCLALSLSATERRREALAVFKDMIPLVSNSTMRMQLILRMEAHSR